jgi:hypothetical protein
MAPGSEGGLLEEAARGSVDRLADKARAARAAARRDGRDAVARMRRRRALTHGRSDDGSAWLRASGPPDDIARALAGLAPWAEEARRRARSVGGLLTEDQARFDGLVAMAGQPLPIGGDDDVEPAGGRTELDGAVLDDEWMDSDALDSDALDSDALDSDPLGSGHLEVPGDASANGAEAGVEGAANGSARRPAVHRRQHATGPGADGRRRSEAPTSRRPDGDASEDDVGGPPSPSSGRARGTPDRAGRRGRPRWAAKVIVNVDLEALRRGFVRPGERCEITGVGELAVAAVDDLVRREDTFVAAVLRDGVEITQVAHFGRGPTAAQRTALEADHAACCIDGCPNPPKVIDHHHRFADGGPRTLGNLGPLCHEHDHRKTHRGWVLVRHGRSRRLFPPNHPLVVGVTPGGCLDLDSPDLDSPDLDSPDLDSPDLDSPDLDDPAVGNPDVGEAQLGLPVARTDVDATDDGAVRDVGAAGRSQPLPGDTEQLDLLAG